MDRQRDFPRYIVWVNSRQFYLCGGLVEALDRRRETGGLVYEPLGLSAAERVASEDDDFGGVGTGN